MGFDPFLVQGKWTMLHYKRRMSWLTLGKIDVAKREKSSYMYVMYRTCFSFISNFLFFLDGYWIEGILLQITSSSLCIGLCSPPHGHCSFLFQWLAHHEKQYIYMQRDTCTIKCMPFAHSPQPNETSDLYAPCILCWITLVTVSKQRSRCPVVSRAGFFYYTTWPFAECLHKAEFLVLMTAK